MDSRDRRSAVEAVIGVLRRLTRIVQVAPFVYLAIYAPYLLFSWLLPDSVLGFLDSIIFVSPVASGGMLVLSRILKLCKWHKAAVLIPLSSQTESFVDGFVFTFTENEIIFLNTAIGITAVLFLYLAHNHFLNDGRKGYSLRNACLLQVQG